MAASFLEQLARQKSYLERSTALFDMNGYQDEAIRLAVVLRVLFHNTKQSTSLLAHLKMRKISLLTTVGVEDRHKDTMYFHGMNGVKMDLDTMSVSIYPNFEDGPEVVDTLPFDKWWEQVIWIKGDLRLTRKQLVLTAANKDGGAHIDKKIPSNYELLSSPNWGMPYRLENTSTGECKTVITHDVHYHAIRQIVWEVLESVEFQEIGICESSDEA